MPDTAAENISFLLSLIHESILIITFLDYLKGNIKNTRQGVYFVWISVWELYASAHLSR